MNLDKFLEFIIFLCYNEVLVILAISLSFGTFLVQLEKQIQEDKF